jgi:uroporphyrinogen decarboxylase
MNQLTEPERYRACMDYQPVDFVPFWSWGAWEETKERWTKEGYDRDKNNPEEMACRRRQIHDWFFPYPKFVYKVIEEDDTHIIYVNHEGILMKELKVHRTSSMPQFLKFPVTNRKELRTFWDEHMETDLSVRVGPDWKEQLKEYRTEKIPLIIIADRWGGFFGPLRNLVGVEQLCMLFYDDPLLVEEMMDRTVEFIIKILGQILTVVEIDAFAMWEDMAYNHAPLISPDMVRTYMVPRYRKVVEFARSKGVKFVGLDSDGQIDSLIPVWMDAGMNFLYPFECQCGMDVVDVRKKYGRELRLWGGLNKRAVATGKDAIEEELARVEPLIEEGGYIPHLDHSCPPDIPFANYRYFLKRLAEVCGKKSGANP